MVITESNGSFHHFSNLHCFDSCDIYTFFLYSVISDKLTQRVSHLLLQKIFQSLIFR